MTAGRKSTKSNIEKYNEEKSNADLETTQNKHDSDKITETKKDNTGNTQMEENSGNKDLKERQYTQESILKKIDSPLEFISAYSQVFNDQIDKKRKVIFNCLEYKDDFETSFLYLLHENDLEKLEEIEQELDKMTQMKYYDVCFFEHIKKLYLKNILILIDKADSNIAEMLRKNKINETETLVESIMIIYKFTDLNIDINLLFLEKITRNFDKYLQRPEFLIDKVIEFQNILDELNKKLQSLKISSFVFDYDLRTKVDLSLNIQGVKRKNGYDSDFIIHFINELKIYILGQEKSIAYLNVMNVKNEMSRRNMNYKCVDELVSMAENLV